MNTNNMKTYYNLYNVICAILIAFCFIKIYSLYSDMLSVFAFNAVAQAIIISNYILSARSFSLKADYYSWIKLLLYEVIVILYNQLLKTNTSILLCIFSIVFILLITIVYDVLIKTKVPQINTKNRLVGRPLVFKIIFMLSTLSLDLSDNVTSTVYLSCIIFIFCCCYSIINYVLAYYELGKCKDIYWCLCIDIVACVLCILFTSYYSVTYPTESFSGGFWLFIPMIFTTNHIRNLVGKNTNS